MSKEYTTSIRVISVDHASTVSAAALLRHALDAHGFNNCKIINSFCHLEAGRCGVPAGMTAIEADGIIVWLGKELTAELAERFCAGLPKFIQAQKRLYGLE